MIGSGAFCLTENIQGISKTYTDNKHHILFENEEELLKLIDSWLKKDNEREEIRKKGFIHAHKYHTYNMRVKEFLNLI